VWGQEWAICPAVEIYTARVSPAMRALPQVLLWIIQVL
jgi:hypothetical protein